ncbi:LrgB family protein [Undibacterium fentianense]|uniref:LrgB family protein n=1 Tax=Undibacterium fentianense TaxID=2828728 RepID=A0A941E4W9_9BURK|nr:LrgB family protein [Undibacterium fentianense]MBR7799798.1 LrgB family protein [Undibacterium fentianense]
MSVSWQRAWTELGHTPMFALGLTLLAYLCALWIAKRCQYSPLANPVVIAVTMIVVVLLGSGISYERYFASAQAIHLMLGPVTVALAIPLARQLPKLRRQLLPLMMGLLAGCLTAMCSAVLMIIWMQGSTQLALSIGPKSATTPIAMGIADKIGGSPSIAAAIVILTGAFGALVARYLFNWMRITSPEIRGFALGLAAHGIGTARAFQVSKELGTFAGLGMGLNGMLTAFIAPTLVPLLVRYFY